MALAIDTEMAGQVVGALVAQGISMSIDHFGMGLTSLPQLCRSGVSQIKIDQRFLVDLPGIEQDRAVVRAIVDLGHSLGCVVTAQGVESQDVADALVDVGFDQAQGYLWLRPCPWTEVARVFGASTAGIDPAATSTVPAGASHQTQG